MDNKLYNTFRKGGNLANIGLLVFTLIPLFALSYYNHPSAVDDFCYIDTVFKYGWTEAMNFYYTGWTGRYFGIFLNHSNPLIFHWFAGFKVLPALLILTLAFSVYLLFRTITPTISRRAHLGFTGVAMFLFVLKMPNIAEGFYWMASFVTYTVPTILTLLWVVLVIRWYRADNRKAQVLIGLAAGFLVFAIIGCSETNLLLIMVLISGWCGYRILFQRRLDNLMIGTVMIAVVSCYLFFSASGNEARLGGNPLSGNIVESGFSSLKKMAYLVYDWVRNTPILIFSLGWVFVLVRMNNQSLTYFSFPPFYALLIYVGILGSQLFPSYYGIGIEPAPRVINCVYFFFIIGWFYYLGVLVHYLRKRNWIQPFANRWGYLSLFCALLFFSLSAIRTTPNFRMIYRDWLKGDAAVYNRAMNNRYELIRAATDKVVYLPSIKNAPQSLFVGDLETDLNRNLLWNRCMAGYFGKEIIYIKEK